MLIKLDEGQYFGEQLSTLENGLFKCSISAYLPGEKIGRHYHENNYLSLLVRGAYSEKSKSGDELLQAGNIIFRPSSYDHANDFQPAGGRCLNIELKQGWKEQADFDLKLPASTQVFPTGSLASFYKLFRYFTMQAGDELCSEMILHCFHEMNAPFRLPSSLPWVEKVKAIIDGEPGTQHTLESISGRVFVHPVYLAAAFKSKTGLTVGEYQLRGRLKRSVALLFNTKMPVNEIAAQSGFYDPAHFVRSFRLAYGMPPQRFRAALNT
jgi:AraC family transcriptional regulator